MYKLNFLKVAPKCLRGFIKSISLTVWLILSTPTPALSAPLIHIPSFSVTPPSTLCLLAPSEVSLDVKEFKAGGIDPLINYNGIPNREPDKQLDLTVNLRIMDYLYMQNTVHSMTDRALDGGAGQFRVVGWHYQLGIHLSQYADVYVEHFSQHLLDTQYEDAQHFPAVDSVGVKIFIYREQPEKYTILP